MKNIILSLIATLMFGAVAQAGTIVLEGKYQQKNIYIINPVGDRGVGFCIYEVLVNGEVTSDEINSNAFEIDLGIYGFELGADVIITINFKDGCEPKVLNSGALEPQPTFETTAVDINDQGLLTWSTINEQGKLPYIIQQFKWNKWVNVGEVMGKGTSTSNGYSFQTSTIAGENKYRVVQKSYDGNFRKSEAVAFDSGKDAVSYTYDKKAKNLSFSTQTNYELYNIYGQIIKRGYADEVDLSSLPKEDYYISFDNQTEKFSRR